MVHVPHDDTWSQLPTEIWKFGDNTGMADFWQLTLLALLAPFLFLSPCRRTATSTGKAPLSGQARRIQDVEDVEDVPKRHASPALLIDSDRL